jgi:hypothetical protein
MDQETRTAELTTGIQAILDLIATGTGEDGAIEKHISEMASSASPDEMRSLSRQIADNVLSSQDLGVTARALKALTTLLPLDTDTENVLDRRLMALIGYGAMAKSDDLAEAVALFIYHRTQISADSARPYLPTLVSLLSQNIATTGAYSYYALMIVANEAPEHYGAFADLLVRALDSPGIAAKVFSMRVIAELASHRPEYVAGARRVLRDLSAAGQFKIIRTEATKAHYALIDSSKTQDERERLIEERPVSRVYNTHVWQHAMEHHLSMAYGNDLLAYQRNGWHHGAKRKMRALKILSMHMEFSDFLRPNECDESIDGQTAALSMERTALAISSGTASDNAMRPSTHDMTGVSLPLAIEPSKSVLPVAENTHDSAGAIRIEELMGEAMADLPMNVGGSVGFSGHEPPDAGPHP